MDIAKLKQELSIQKYDDLAFIVGNGVNIYAFGNKDWSWENLLNNAWYKATGNKVNNITGMSLTEMYDLISFQNISEEKKDSFKNAIIKPLKDSLPTPKHKQIQRNLKKWNVPVLTTNFDSMLETDYVRNIFIHPKQLGRYHAMSDLYPWDRYFAPKQSMYLNPNRDYAIWHINGFLDFNRSIKLSLTEYMAQVSHARAFLHRRPDGIEDFSEKSNNYWRGYNTWLHVIFNCSLCIIGLGLNQDETFLRWLLIERKKYFNKGGVINHKGWYVYKNGESFPNGKDLFLNSVGILPVPVDDYSDIYEKLLSL